MNSKQPVLITSTSAIRIVLALHQKIPEFEALNRKYTQSRVKVTRGCQGCGARKKSKNIYNDFIGVINGLDNIKLNQVKRFLGTEKLMFNQIKGNQYEVVTL